MNVGAVRALVELVAEQGFDIAKKAMVVLNSLAAIQEGKDAIVEEWRNAALVEAIEDGSMKDSRCRGKKPPLPLVCQRKEYKDERENEKTERRGKWERDRVKEMAK
ncbi:uncharacterized protein DS421_14g463500 [Arachis hypogaea]|uniref:U-box domain-containing protein n=1 Tax=Arachis hypogaea TaxID=3818 RepID=A0A444ZMU8_ARAHY|nr:uncharacterized protein DS421_14g463500 [Arachis hypogaea]RYR15516.1 hypothetical protein Ahy_B04g072290 [Arachis hypogaea]